MSAQSNAAPVIIKRKKIIAGGGHHGGAWKVAIAFSFGLRRFAPITYPAPYARADLDVILTSAARS